MAVIIPMGLFNVIGSLQNLESAEAARRPLRNRCRPCWPTASAPSPPASSEVPSPPPSTSAIPAGRPWAPAAGYSILNGVVITAAVPDRRTHLVLKFIPIECTLGILLWIAIIITAQAFQEIPKQHALAVALGLIPSFASWVLLQIETTLRMAGTSLFAMWDKFGVDLYIRGVVALSQGFILTSMVLAAAIVFMIDRELPQGRLLDVRRVRLIGVGPDPRLYVDGGRGADENSSGWPRRNSPPCTPSRASCWFGCISITVGTIVMENEE